MTFDDAKASILTALLALEALLMDTCEENYRKHGASENFLAGELQGVARAITCVRDLNTASNSTATQG